MDDSVTQFVSEEPAVALAGLIDSEVPDDRTLPPLWHFAYLLDYPRQADIGPDGHPTSGVFPVPPRPGLRRMFAGGRVWSNRRMRTGIRATSRSTVISTSVKEGRSGTLTFVTVRREVVQASELVLTEERDLVYREPLASPPASQPDHPGPAVPVEPHEYRVAVDPTLLFRFSAATYNSHRIHYDQEYARTVEGYPERVVHGPLLAVLMAEQVRRAAVARVDARPYRFEFRLQAPLFLGQGLVVGAVEDGASFRTYARDTAGRITAEGSYSIT